MKCPCCGIESPFEDALFCAHCGYKLRSLINFRERSLNEKIAQRLKIIGNEELSKVILRSQINWYSSFDYDGRPPCGSYNLDIEDTLPHDRVDSQPPNTQLIRSEVIIMTVKGFNKDLSIIKSNQETIRNELTHYFREQGIYVDIERFIFTLEEGHNEPLQGATSEQRRVSYNILLAEKVLDDLIEVGERICLNSAYTSNASENSINDAVRDMLYVKGYYEVKDQTRHGISYSGQKSGYVDLLLAKGRKEVAVIEALKLSYINGPYIDEHILKAVINYNPLGTATFIIAYVNTLYFKAFWYRFYNHIKSYNFHKSIKVKQGFEELFQPNATTRIAKVILSKDGYEFPVYFIVWKISSE